MSRCCGIRWESKGWDISQKSADVLLKNAEVFYRGGKNVASAAGEEGVEREGRVKEAVVKGIRGDGGGMWGLLGGDGGRGGDFGGGGGGWGGYCGSAAGAGDYWVVSNEIL